MSGMVVAVNWAAGPLLVAWPEPDAAPDSTFGVAAEDGSSDVDP